MCENLKISIVIKNVIWSEKNLMQKAVHPSNYFFQCLHYNQAEQIRKEVICVKILFEIYLTEHGSFHFQGRTTFYTPLGPTQQAHDVKMTSMLCNDIT